MTRFCLIGPSYPYRGGIAHYTALLAHHLRQGHETLLISFTRQYPQWLFPGRSDRDPSRRPLQTPAEYLLDPLSPVSWRRTLRRIRAWQPDAVVVPWWVPFWAPTWMVLGRGIKRLPGRPKLVFICHNVLPHESGRFDRLALRLALAPADAFVVHARSDAERLMLHFPQARVAVTPLPTYEPLLATDGASLPVTLPDDRPILLFCGFVRPYKGLDVLLDALPLVLSRRPVHLLVAGEFWHGEAAYRAQIERLGLQDAVTILNRYLPNETLAACLARADLVVLPYRSASQSAIVQLAFGQGIPVITTDVGGLADAVMHDSTGLVVPPENPQALAEAIERYFAEGLGPRFATNIHRESGRFAWQRLTEQLELIVHDQAADGGEH